MMKMIIIVDILEIVFLVVLGSAVGYLAVLSVAALFQQWKEPRSVSRLRRFAIVIPAHNEEGTIEKTLKGLCMIDYPRELFDVVVVADNCTDRTAEAARALGAQVFERKNESERGKGFALRWCFDRLLAEGKHEAMAVVDADSIVSKNFLRVMNGYLDGGAVALQANDVPLPQPGAWSSEVVRVGMTLYNVARPLGRRAFGCSAGLRGNGMCFSAETLKKVPWRAFSLTEDLEYGLELLLNGIVVHLVPEASVLATMPANTRNAASQRARWETGRFPVVKLYALRLLKEAWKRRSFRLLDALIDLVMPPFVNLFAAVMCFLATTAVLTFFGLVSTPWMTVMWAVILLVGLAHVVLGLLAAHADATLFFALLHIPRFAVWKLLLYARILTHGSQKEWIRTTREFPSTHPDRPAIHPR